MNYLLNILLILILLVSQACLADDKADDSQKTDAVSKPQDQSKFSLGVKGGLLFSKPSLTSATLEQKTGSLYGVQLEFFLSDLVALDLEAIYSKQGYKRTSSITGLTVTQDIAYDYLELPVLFKFKTMKGFFSVNPYLGFFAATILSAKYKYSFSGAISLAGETDIKSEFTKINAGGVAGIDFEFHLNPKLTIDVDGRYSRGLINIIKNSPTIELTTAYIAAMLGLKFHL